MMWSNENQRKAVMSKYSRLDTGSNTIKTSSYADSLVDFSKKGDRGAVPLLESTFVIRGGIPSERKKVKVVLDTIGEDPSMTSVNQIRIVRGTDTPITFEGEKTIVVSEEFLKGGPYELGILTLAMAYRMKHPEEQEGREYVYAKEVVEPKIKEKIRIQEAKLESAATEVYQVGTKTQPDYEVVSYDGPDVGPVEAKVTFVPDKEEGERVPDEQIMLGVGTTDRDEFNREMEEKMRRSAFGGIN